MPERRYQTTVVRPDCWELLRKDDYLGAEDQSGAEADLQGQAAAELGVFLEQAVGGQRDGGCRGVAGVGDVPGDDDGIRAASAS